MHKPSRTPEKPKETKGCSQKVAQNLPKTKKKKQRKPKI
jgi:hypothetical protein